MEINHKLMSVFNEPCINGNVVENMIDIFLAVKSHSVAFLRFKILEGISEQKVTFPLTPNSIIVYHWFS